MIRLAVFDIDRTLIPAGFGQIAPETKAAIQALQQQGIRTAIGSGRMKNLLPAELREIGFDYFILSNGTYVTDGSGQVLCRETVNPAVAQALVAEMIRRDLAIDIRYTGGMVPGNPNRDVRQAMKEYWLRQGVVMKPPKDLLWHIEPPAGQHPISFDAYIPMEQLPELAAMFPELDFLSVFEGPMCDINPKGVSKATGVRRICEMLGISMTQTIAFGDDRNDLEMIAEAGIGVAMGNGIQPVKDAANYITDTCENLGVVKALQHFGLID